MSPTVTLRGIGTSEDGEERRRGIAEPPSPKRGGLRAPASLLGSVMACSRLAALLVVATTSPLAALGACSSFSGEPPTAVDAGDGPTQPDGDPGEAGEDVRADRTTPSSYRDAILAAGPLAYWRMGVTAGL